MSHSATVTSPERPNVQAPVQRIEEQSSPLINTITAIAVSIISTILCYMTLPPQGATSIVAVVWILAYYFSFGSDCLDNAPLPLSPPARPICRSPIPHDTRPGQKHHFVSPQKKLQPHERPGGFASFRDTRDDHQFEAGSERKTDDRQRSNYEIHTDNTRHKRALRHDQRLAELERQESTNDDDGAFSLSSEAKKVFKGLMGSDSDEANKQVKAGSGCRTQPSKQTSGSRRVGVGSRRRTDT